MHAWYGFALAAAVSCVSVWSAAPRLAWPLFILLAVSLIFAQYWGNTMLNVSTRAALSLQLSRPFSELSRWSTFLSGPQLWVSAQEQQQTSAIARLRDAQPLTALDGTVDVIPSMQSVLIANGMRYSPRPTIQEYTTYTRGLIEKNRAFFRGPRAPDYLLMAPGSIDGRHPASAEGALWPELLSRYTPQGKIENLVLLRRRIQPISISMPIFRTETAELGSRVSLDSKRLGAVFTTIDVRPTIAGRLANLLFKSAEIYIDVHYADGMEKGYRLIPAMAREGFFLSPLIETGADYLALAVGMENVIPHRVKSFTLRSGLFGRWFWQSKFTVMFATLDSEHIRDNSDLRSMSSKPKQQLELLDLLSGNT
jgi:hypothetical protein